MPSWIIENAGAVLFPSARISFDRFMIAESTVDDHRLKYQPQSLQNSSTRANIVVSRSDEPTHTTKINRLGDGSPSFLIRQYLRFMSNKKRWLRTEGARIVYRISIMRYRKYRLLPNEKPRRGLVIRRAGHKHEALASPFALRSRGVLTLPVILSVGKGTNKPVTIQEKTEKSYQI